MELLGRDGRGRVGPGQKRGQGRASGGLRRAEVGGKLTSCLEPYFEDLRK